MIYMMIYVELYIYIVVRMSCNGFQETHLLPDGYLDSCSGDLVLVTTSSLLQDPPTEALRAAYGACHASFHFVGPLLPAPSPDALAERLRAHQGRTVAVSMGTVVTGDDRVVGWAADFSGRSLKGRELCRAVWQGVFEAFAPWRAAISAWREPLGPRGRRNGDPGETGERLGGSSHILLSFHKRSFL